MNVKSVLSAVVLSALAAACYGSAPGRPPKVPLPELADAPDAHLSVHSVTNTAIENVEKSASSCPQGHNPGDPLCTVTRYEVAEPVTRTTTTAALGGEAINFAQFTVMTDPEWNHKLARLDELSHKCRRANVPRYLGYAMMIGGVVTGEIVRGDNGPGIMTIGALAGAATFTLGYFAFGGSDCVAAQSLYDHMNLWREMTWTSVEGADYPSQMRALAEQFNAAHGGHASAQPPPDEHTKPAPSHEPAKKPSHAARRPATKSGALHMR